MYIFSHIYTHRHKHYFYINIPHYKGTRNWMIHVNMPFSESRGSPGLYVKLSKGRGAAHVREELRASGVAEHQGSGYRAPAQVQVKQQWLQSIPRHSFLSHWTCKWADSQQAPEPFCLCPYHARGVGSSKLLDGQWRFELRSSCLHSKSSLIH